ncbi:MAG: hypothetical protein FD147_743 [Chloroflexi bacterium]|nr:MAG: hypothetical protein FD147_743 [Chloroflexota bacterium]
MRTLIVISFLILSLTACVRASNNPDIPLINEAVTSQPALSATAIENSLPIVIPEPTKEDDGLTYVEFTNGNLWLHLFSPKDGDIVTQPLVIVSGQAPAETVISLNETISLVTEDSNFSMPVVLEEGPNVIEVVASNMDGDEISFILTILYEK